MPAVATSWDRTLRCAHPDAVAGGAGSQHAQPGSHTHLSSRAPAWGQEVMQGP
jgi:hypothetical protein